MGQYQQWLYYQEVDRRLRADLEALEIELTHIQEQARELEQTISLADNTIIRTLAAILNAHTPTNKIPALPSENTLQCEPATPHSRLHSASADSIDSTSSEFPAATIGSSRETVSPALYGWGALPNFGQEDMQFTFPSDRVLSTQSEDSVPASPHLEMALLPEDMVAFFDAHDQTDPQLELPWWMGKVAAFAHGAHSPYPIGQENIRTNSQVQRWRERWEQPSSIEQPSQKNEDTAPVGAGVGLSGVGELVSARETARQVNLNELNEIYTKLKAQDIEQFYAGYLWWKLHQHAVALQEQRAALQRETAANAELMEMVHPPAIALATMARLQASGVSDIVLLDRLLERSEDWLDRTMQRLDYCEQLNFIIDDYTQWCRNALEGAYDWIDSMRESKMTSPTEVPTGDTSIEATEELLLQKLASEEEEQSPGAIKTSSSPDDTMSESQEEQVSQLSQASQPVETSHGSDPAVEVTSASDQLTLMLDNEQSMQNEYSERSTGIEVDKLEHAERSIPDVMLERRRNFLQRLAAKIW